MFNKKEIENLKEENERLKDGYCELKIKCNNGECDCSNEEYDTMVQSNMKLSLENDKYEQALLDIKEELENTQFHFARMSGKTLYAQFLNKLLDIVNKTIGSDSDE